MKVRSKETALTVVVLSVALLTVSFLGLASDKKDKEQKIVGMVVKADTVGAAKEKIDAVAIEVLNHIMSDGKEQPKKQEKMKSEADVKIKGRPEKDAERYLVGDNEKGYQLMKLVGKTVEATGLVKTDAQGNKTIAVTKFTVLEDKPETPKKKTTRKY